MWYIYITGLILILIGAAKRRRRSRGRFVALPFNTQQALGTLADETVVSADLTTNLAEDFYAISVDIVATVADGSAGDGPIEIGVAHDDYTAAEIKEFIDVNLTDPDNKIDQERSRRLIRRLGSIVELTNAPQVPRSGDPKRIPLRFILGDGHTLSAWVMNHTGSAMTTGAVVTFSGTIYGRWLR